MSPSSKRSRSEKPAASKRAAGANKPVAKGPAEKKHKNMAQVRATGRQSDQG